jgi:signal transduction histidine kinase
MTEAERVLEVLIHDVRTPLGVAQGYVRLLREERLETPEERDRALVKTLDALARIARLCDDASSFLPSGRTLPLSSVAAAVLIAGVENFIRETGFVVDRSGADPAAKLRLGPGTERLGEAVGVVLSTVSPAGTSPRLRVATGPAELRFTATPNADGPPEDAAAMPFNAWNVRGLAVPAAVHEIVQAGGRVWRADHALAVAFPLETPRP